MDKNVKSQKVAKVDENGNFEISFEQVINGLTEKQIETLKAKAVRQLIKNDKDNLKAKYRGLFNVFNFVKKDSEIFGDFLRKNKIEPVQILGSLTVNESLNVIRTGAKYSVDTVVNLVTKYVQANDKKSLELRGTKLNGFFVESQKSEANKGQILFDLLLNFSLDERKKISKTNAKFLLETSEKVFTAINYDGKFNELLQPIETAEKSEAVESETAQAV